MARPAPFIKDFSFKVSFNVVSNYGFKRPENNSRKIKKVSSPRDGEQKQVVEKHDGVCQCWDRTQGVLQVSFRLSDGVIAWVPFWRMRNVYPGSLW